jgi:hypothetical protein
MEHYADAAQLAKTASPTRTTDTLPLDQLSGLPAIRR